MEPGSIKPLLTALALPPLSLLLLALLGLLLVAGRRKRTGASLLWLALTALWVLSCHGAAVWLAQNALPQYPPASAVQITAGKAQAIVVLGGGVLPLAPEYGKAQPSSSTGARLRYGIWLGRQTGLPLAFTGGMGHAASNTQGTSEAAVAARVAQQEYGVPIRWLESASRDTTENARLLAPLLKRDGVQRIALVTNAAHMPRAVIAFEREGFVVQAAPTGYIVPRRSTLLEWLPSASGLQATQEVLHEWLGILAGRVLKV